VPIYFSSAMASRANQLYSLLVSWAHPDLAQRPDRHQAFAFSAAKQWDRSLIDQPGAGAAAGAAAAAAAAACCCLLPGLALLALRAALLRTS
jgi:glycerate kinase